MEKEYPYVAIIEEYYKTSKGNYLCREKDQDINTHPYDWPIFVPEEYTKEISSLPVFGLIIKDYNQAFRGGERITCRKLSYDSNQLQSIVDESFTEEGRKRAEIWDRLRRNQSK
jgi:hypothetical protein